LSFLFFISFALDQMINNAAYYTWWENCNNYQNWLVELSLNSKPRWNSFNL